ncbi:hypothetical protein HPB47_018905 [Ixodes persulcatus]|uniref:Uncharacterized protein n=1 Tax=Ixodes persulcatus TaxID=34615 RepID=A0AC60QJQ8_IXOPE|nr:hypothetical protein HPB47_018905 [Ixodes persulcatus]
MLIHNETPGEVEMDFVAMLDITLLCGSVAMLGHVYLPINRHASKLMAPCFLWTFTTALFNYSVWRCQKHYCSF